MARRNPSEAGPWIFAGVSIVVAGALILLIRRSWANSDVLELIRKELTPSQRKMAQLIANEFKAAGFPPVAQAAAIVNAWVESKLNPEAVGDSGHSIGLFQLHDKGGGAGLSVEYRANPVNNTRTILEREVLGHFGKRFRQRVADGAKVGELAAIFSQDIERPADVEGNKALRASLAEQWFPSLA